MFCPDIMDFEASGFGPDSYPIEVGFVLAGGERFCMLIRPHASWTHWDPDAERVHGISRQLLARSALDIRQVCTELNRRLQGRTLYSDAWVVDQVWCDRMFYTAGIPRRFQLSAIEHVQSECQYLLWDSTRRGVIGESPERRHRASIDAELIQRVYRRTQSLCAPLQRSTD